MAESGYTLFETAIGTCGAAWSAKGLVAVQLPEASTERTRARLLRRNPALVETSPSGTVADAVAGMTALLAGKTVDLAEVALDLAQVPHTDQRVYAIMRTVRPGETTTYGAIATQLGDGTLARAVGQALGRNPVPIVVPCHRVLAAAGGAGGFSAAGGVATKLRMLEIERRHAPAGEGLFGSLPLAVRPGRGA